MSRRSDKSQGDFGGEFRGHHTHFSSFQRRQTHFLSLSWKITQRAEPGGSRGKQAHLRLKATAP